MCRTAYSEQLLTDIKNGVWREPELTLSHSIPKISVQKLASALLTNPYIKILSISSNQIDAEGATILAQNTTLQSLDISYNQVGNEGAKALAQNTTLTSLDLSFNDIGAEGAKAFAQNTALTSLNLNYNNIGAEGTKALAQNPALMWLNLTSNHIDAEAEKAIREMLMRNKKLRQASLTTAINQLIAVPDLIPIILAYSADYTAEEARQRTSRATKSEKQADEESTHNKAIATNNSVSSQSVAASVNGFFSGGGSSVNVSNVNSHTQTAGSASSEGRRFLKPNA